MQSDLRIVVLPDGPDSPLHSTNSGGLNDELEQSMVFDSLFTTSRPRDICSGSYHGVLNVLRGVGAGVTTLVVIIGGCPRDDRRQLIRTPCSD